ncbi:hypothetical protein [uncultured Microbulbifer sp.]|uniref:hypothetical protein n=1 Tax=uncultured Microbulbifer sp. TaxID=348147 RepID=UPI00262AB7E4|nr:hypothetical protein [uncultured Microbulbifer sp.]
MAVALPLIVMRMEPRQIHLAYSTVFDCTLKYGAPNKIVQIRINFIASQYPISRTLNVPGIVVFQSSSKINAATKREIIDPTIHSENIVDTSIEFPFLISMPSSD